METPKAITTSCMVSVVVGGYTEHDYNDKYILVPEHGFKFWFLSSGCATSCEPTRFDKVSE